jgi:transcriptional activator of cad operon
VSDIIYKVNDLLFDQRKQTLLLDRTLIQLEPRQAEVLGYMCRHPNKLISRDELIEQVWQGQIVTDNAVNRVIAKLRKSLGDDAKNAEFIQTLPRKGYKFIARISLFEPELESQFEITSETRKLKPWLSIFIAAVIIAIVVLVFFIPSAPATKGVIALTRGGGQEDSGIISPNQQYLTYTEFADRQSLLYVKDLKSSKVTQLSDGKGFVGSSSWSHDSNKVIYFYNNDEVCQIRQITLLQGKINNRETLHNCPLASHGQVTFNHGDKQIIYSEKQTGDKPYHIFTMDLGSGARRKLNQPPTFNAGHLVFDLHPSQNKLLLSTPDEQQWHAFFEIDLGTNQFSYLFSKDEYICCAIYNNQGDKVVVMGTHPAYDFVDMDLDGSNLRTIYTASHGVGAPKRITNTNDYTYTGGYYNFDIYFYDYNSQRTIAIADSSVVDKLPTIASDGSNLAYISGQTGTSQIWLQDLKTKRHHVLTKFTDHRMYQDLLFSPNAKNLSVLMRYGVKIVDASSGQSSALKVPQQSIRGISWVDDNTLAFSMKVDRQWQVHHYNIDADKLTATDKQWAYIRYAVNSAETVYVDHDGTLYIDGEQLDIGAYNAIDHFRVFNFKVFNGELYYRPLAPDSWDLYKLNLRTFISEKVVEINRQAGFSVTAKGVYFTHLTSLTADIFRTQ